MRLGDRAKERKPVPMKDRRRKATPCRRRNRSMLRRHRRNLVGAEDRLRRTNPRAGLWSGGSQIGGSDFARDPVFGGDRRGLALQLAPASPPRSAQCLWPQSTGRDRRRHRRCWPECLAGTLPRRLRFRLPWFTRLRSGLRLVFIRGNHLMRAMPEFRFAA